MDANLIPYLREQFSKARPILFTGAGFSCKAQSIEGGSVATSKELKERLWQLTFPDDLFDESSTLQNVYESALIRRRSEIRSHLSRILSVKPDSIPQWYKLYFGLPWYKIYTLNIDDLASAAYRKFSLPRKLNPVSGIQEHTGNQKPESDYLNVIHLNGTLEDLPDNVTFSLTHYAERLAHLEPVYMRLVGELVSHPFVFVGTRLEEPPLWQHIQMRAEKGGRIRELRKRSLLITRSLDKAREVTLSSFNIGWLQMDAEQFANEVLSQLVEAGEEGQKFLSSLGRRKGRDVKITELSEVEINPFQKTDFLVGEEPTWSDIQKGHAIERSIDGEILKFAKAQFESTDSKGALCLTGTSGCGKSTSLMRLALRFSADGARVGWLNSTSELASHEILKAVEGQRLAALIIDEADFMGGEINAVLRQAVAAGVFVAIGMRTTKMEQLLNPALLDGVRLKKFYLEDLTDGDIDELLDVLEKENRLGEYFKLPRAEQRTRFRSDTGRQLLIGMIKATSGEKLEVKVPHELEQLAPLSQTLYGSVCVANYLNGFVTKQDLLIISGNASNEALNKIEELQQQRLIAFKEGSSEDLRARHRLVAELVFKHLQLHGGLLVVLSGIAVATASKLRDDMPTRAKPRRLLTRLISHDFLIGIFGEMQARNFYASLETALKSDSHYWLQRGCLELEYDGLKLAETFIQHARALNATDNFIQTGFAHLLFRKACANPNLPDARQWVTDAETILSVTCRSNNPKAYHILCSQGLAWERRGLKTFEEKRAFLSKLRQASTEATKAHPTDHQLKSLKEAIEGEYMSLAIKM